jgi:hypothetical protein
MLVLFKYNGNIYQPLPKYFNCKMAMIIHHTKAVIIIRISKKNIQHNGQKKRYKRTNNDLQNIHIKLKIENNLCEKAHIFVLF